MMPDFEIRNRDSDELPLYSRFINSDNILGSDDFIININLDLHSFQVLVRDFYFQFPQFPL